MKKECVETVNIKSPTRIDLAGGFLDIWPVHALIRDCFVVNCSIPVFTFVNLSRSKLEDHKVRCVNTHKKNVGAQINIEISSPFGLYRKSFFGWNKLLEESQPELHLLKKHIEYWSNSCFKYKAFQQGAGDHQSSGLNHKWEKEQTQVASFNSKSDNSENEEWNISLKSDSPVGGGLGASSSLCVSLVQAFSSLFHCQFTQVELLSLCRDLETSLLHAPAGIQDYIPSMDPVPDFMYIIECSPFGPKWKKIETHLEFFKEHLLLVDTGKSHHSGDNNWENLKRVMEKDQIILRGLSQLRDNALKTAELCEKGNWSDLFSCLNREQNLREKLFSNWINAHVNSVINLVQEEGAPAVKLCGAGGGGCLMVLAKSKKNKKHIKHICEKNHIPVVMS